MNADHEDKRTTYCTSAIRQLYVVRRRAVNEILMKSKVVSANFVSIDHSTAADPRSRYSTPVEPAELLGVQCADVEIQWSSQNFLTGGGGA